jgi:NYN domain
VKKASTMLAAWSRWRLRFSQRRSTGRLVVACILFIGGAMIVVSTIIAPSFWPALKDTAIQDILVAADAPIFWPILGGSSVLIIAVLLVCIPRPLRYHSLPAANMLPAPIAVYLDLENQQIAQNDVARFIRYLNNYIAMHCAPGRIEYYLFADLTLITRNEGGARIYREYWRHGFRAIDAVHQETNHRNMADMMLALYAYERALLSSIPQDIILISRDSDFVALIYQLRYHGHRVHLLAKELTPDWRRLAIQLDMPIDEYGNIFTNPASDPEFKIATALSSPSTDHEIQSFGFGNTTMAFMQTAMAQSLAVVVRTQQAGQRKRKRPIDYNTLKSIAGASLPPALNQLGYVGEHRLDDWLNLMIALNILANGPPPLNIAPGTGTPAQGSQILDRFIDLLTDTIRNVTKESPNQPIRFEQLALQIISDPRLITDPSLAGIATMLTRGPINVSSRHTRHLIRCAIALGKLYANEVNEHAIILPGTT